MNALDGFTTFNFDEGLPYVSLTSHGITFNKAVTMKLGYPERAILLINSSTHQIALQRCSDETENSMPFYNAQKKSKVLSVRWNSKDLLNTLSDLMGWDLTIHSFRVAGKLLKAENAMVFNLDEATQS